MTLEELEPTPSQAPLVEMARGIAGFAKQVIEQGEELAPIMQVDTGRGHALVSVAELFDRAGDPELRGPALRAVLRQIGAAAYVLAVEGWSLPPGAMPRGGRQLRPISQDERRVSVLMITGETLAGDQLLGMWRIVEARERRLDLTNPEQLELGKAGSGGRDAAGGPAFRGRLFGLLEDPG